ncbi:hypothetical protein VF04_04195 [Nostoc linckia z7]|uniref:Uncharacterized protein n=2 Tax=Nostoc linckia TaxID=92942 RepID=A0A9Q5ZG47_NOSLI|nr:hypothetical protein [Nostoc linckia]PHK42914.1 hypothetical protein VF12_00895 [Nostoc linckia z15]PHK48071.1 hypothetical protein VF13_01870 [Nostoc linckia z16]PHJ64991.1 hypothetical protein VF02_11680 [Nostoc linckia z1]PHJ70169.1 hypothetical protein VF05_11840 [Nostoc linckia z3]PHJ75070.1 hypothetical protein VF03_12000 [Nostoc linckia z2]
MKSYVIQLCKQLTDGDEIVALVDTVDGSRIRYPFEIKLKIANQYIRKGGWAMRNAYLDNAEVVIQDKEEREYHTSVLFFEAHNSGIKD